LRPVSRAPATVNAKAWPAVYVSIVSFSTENTACTSCCRFSGVMPASPPGAPASGATIDFQAGSGPCSITAA
jgi:hypothetical protein